MKTTVIHHSADYDGIFCREIARKFLPDAELIGWDFGNPPLAIPDGKIYVLDLPVDRIFGFQYPKDPFPTELKERVIWIDHHKSSIESFEPQEGWVHEPAGRDSFNVPYNEFWRRGHETRTTPPPTPLNIPGYRIDGVAACRLAWFYFTAENRYWHQSESPSREWFQTHYPFATKQDFVDRKVEEPLAVRLAGEYDIWDKRDPNADVFQFGLRSQELSPQKWAHLLTDDVGPDQAIPHKYNTLVLGLLTDGKMLQTYQQRNDAGMMERSFIVEWEGLKFLALTTARCNSLTFAAKDVPETGHDALMGFYYSGKKWSVSLYHAKHNTGIDLSKIAVKYGGGGHRGACGFQAIVLPFV
jgi:hypothetical protein